MLSLILVYSGSQAPAWEPEDRKLQLPELTRQIHAQKPIPSFRQNLPALLNCDSQPLATAIHRLKKKMANFIKLP